MKRLCCLAALACIGTAHAQSWDIGNLINAGKSLTESQAFDNMSEADEVAIGRDIAASTLGAYRLIRNETLQRRLNSIGTWVALQSSRPTLPWRFAAVDSDAINAYAAPGGTVMITRGLLNTVSNEAELACVIGHEIAHITHKHHLSVLATMRRTEGLTNVAMAAYSRNSGNNELKQFLVSQGKEIFNRGLDRSAEQQADEEGVLLAARAGYDPGACLTFMQRLAGMKGDSNALASLYKTHPSAADRSAVIEASLRRLQGATPGEGARPALSLATADTGNGKKKK